MKGHFVPHSEESKRKMSLARKGRPAWNKGMKKPRPPKVPKINTGRFVKGQANPKSLEWRQMMSQRMKGKYLGKKLSPEIRAKVRAAHVRGDKHPMWKGGVTPINEKLRKTVEYKLWRTAVFERDNFTCVWCGQVGGSLNVDHIKPFAHYPALRFAIDNGRTLCVPCHRKTDTYGNRGKKK